MKTFAGDMHPKSKGDRITRLLIPFSYFLLFGLIAIICVIGLSSMSSVARKLEENPNRFATFTAQKAARAGVAAAVNHIQCHSYREAGGIPRSFSVEAGEFRVIWEEPNLQDSTVRIISFGFCEKEGESLAETSIDTTASLDFFSATERPKMGKYYSLHLSPGLWN